MTKKIVGRRFAKVQVTTSEIRSEQDLKDFLQQFGRQEDGNNKIGLSFEDQVEQWKSGAKEFLSRRGLPHEPFIYFGKSNPDQWQPTEPEDFRAVHCIEHWILSKGYERGNLEHLAAGILKTINRLEHDKGRALYHACKLGYLVALFNVHSALDAGCSSGGKISGEERAALAEYRHGQIIDRARQLLDEDKPRRGLASLLSCRFDLSPRQINEILKKAGI